MRRDIPTPGADGAADYVVRFRYVPAEVVVRLAAADEDEAADRAWELAQEHLQSTAMVAPALGVEVNADLDGIGADEVTPA